MIKITRRHFISLGIIITGCTLSGFAAKFWPKLKSTHTLSPQEQELVTRYVDLLIPADETPGAIDLDVHQKIMQRTVTNTFFRELIKLGGDWLDRHAQRLYATDFLDLIPQDQVHLIELSERSRQRTVQQRLFWYMRHYSFEYYYGDSRSWAQLGFRGPPQPLGHYDYQLPPNKV